MDFVYDVLEPMGLPLVSAYFTAKENIFLNSNNEDAKGFESFGNWALTPVRYLLNGKKISHLDLGTKTCEVSNEFTKKDGMLHQLVKTALAVLLLAPSLIIGCAFKGLAFLYEETRVNDSIIRANMHMVTDLPAKIIANKEKYAALGIDVNPQQTVTVHPNPVVKPSLDDPLLPKEVKKILESQKIDNAAFKIIVDVLMKAGVLWWVDYGTALGVYRHEGVIPWDKDIDLSILAPDHNVVKNLLKEHLDPKKFDVWDFSPNSKPNSMLKIRIKETNMLIDVYHYIIEDAPTEQSKLDEVPLPSAPKKQITYEFSHIHEWYIPEEALKREVRRSYEPEVIFPLKKAKFDGVEVFVPNKLEDYLLANYSRSEASKKKTKEERLKELEPCRIWDETTKKYEKVPDHPYFKESAFNY